MHTDQAVGLKTPRLQELDLLRLVAALMVVAAHYLSSSTEKLRVNLKLGSVFDWGEPLSKFAHLGELGVDVFFMISGYVIAMSTEGRSMRFFLASRAARVLPAFWFCCLLTWVLIEVDPGYRDVSVPQLLANLFFLARPLGYQFVDGVYWSLVVEIRFYLLVAVVMWWRGTQGFVVFLSVWLALAAIDTLLTLPTPVKMVVLPQYAPYFIFGSAMYLIGRRHHTRLAYGLCAGALTLLAFKVANRLPPLFPGQEVAIAAVLSSAALALWLVATKRTESFGRPWMSVAGSLTYPLYLLHQDLGYLFMRYFPATGLDAFDNRFSITLLAVALFLLASFAVVRIVERPLAPIVRRLLSGETRRTSVLSTGKAHV
jgi:peptidoglycan/LPS O-acetylase OafA/YrhL